LGYSNMDSEQLVTRLQSAGFWTVEHLMEAFEALYDSGTLPEYADGVYHPLRAEDWERIARLCQAGNADLALIWGLKQSLDLDNTSSFVFDNIIVQPHSRPMGAPLMPVRRSTNGYSISQRKRKRVEECFGSLKTIALLRKVRHRGVFKVGWVFTFAAAAYNLVRMRNLAIQAT
jgi:hypothetical protein